MKQWGQCRSVKRVEIIASTISGSLKDQLSVELDDMKRSRELKNRYSFFQNVMLSSCHKTFLV